jgi:hypothetical protein
LLLRCAPRQISGHVAFEEELDLAPFWSPPPPPAADADAGAADANGDADGAAAAAAPPPVAPPPARYRLSGVVEHSGGLHGGHYVAFVRRSGDGDAAGSSRDAAPSAWHYASDRHVRSATLAEALAAEAYMLFYTRADVAGDADADAEAEAAVRAALDGAAAADAASEAQAAPEAGESGEAMAESDGAAAAAPDAAPQE